MTQELIYDNWGQRAERLEPKTTTDQARIYEVGSYTVTVPMSPEEPVLVSHRYQRWGQRDPIPNLYFTDEGDMVVPIRDLVDLVLARTSPAELAEGLWDHEEVREAFTEMMVNRYRGQMTDEERQRFLTQVQQEVHSVALRRAIELLEDRETGLRISTSYKRWHKAEAGMYRQLYEDVERTVSSEEERQRVLATHLPPDRLDAALQEAQDPVDLESVGPEWHAARDYWRARLEALFTAGPPLQADFDGVI